MSANGYNVNPMTISRWRDRAKASAGEPLPEKIPRKRYPKKKKNTPQQKSTALLSELKSRFAKPAEETAADEAPLEINPADLVASQQSMINTLLKLADDAKKVGNVTAAQRAMRDAQGAMTVLARLKRDLSGDADVLKISRAEIDDAMASVTARAWQLTQRPFVCQECGRKVSIAWGEYKGSGEHKGE
jgi:hypothetical protein